MINFFFKFYPPPSNGGGMVFFHNIVNRIDSDIRLYTHKNAINPNLSNVKIFPLSFIHEPRKPPSGIRLYWSSLRSLLYFISSQRKILIKDGIHLGQIWPYGLVSLILYKLFNIKYTVFIIGEELSTVVLCKTLKYRFMQLLYKKIISSSTHIFAYSTYTRYNIQKLFNNNYIENISLLSIGMDVENFTNSQFTLHKDFTPKNDQIILFSICRHIERKGLINLIESLKLLDKKNNNWHQYIAGVGPLTTKLKKKVNDLGLSQSITFLGRISESELHGCYKKSDIFLLPNMILDNGDADGCPVVFIEASAYGIPCIGGDVPGTQDAIIDGETGFIINSNNHELIKNKIDFLINNEDKRKNMGIQAKELILKSYKWEDRLELIRKVNDKISNK